MLQILTEALDAGTVLCKGLAPTVSGFQLSKNRVQPYLLGTTFAIRKMFELHRGGFAELQEEVAPPQPYVRKRKIYRTPTNSQINPFLLPSVLLNAIRSR